MADGKTFDATPARLARAKREGDSPRSQDLCGLSSFAGASLALLASLGPLAGAARGALAGAARGDYAPWPYATLALCVLAVLFAALAGALLATYLQTSTFTFVFPAAKFAKLDPFAGFKRMFSRDSAMGGAKAVVVAGAVGATIVPALQDAFAASIGAAGPGELAALVCGAARKIAGCALGVGLLFSIGDVLLERTKWRRRLRMNFAEVKRDHKQSEGDPTFKGRRRQAHRALLRGSIGRLREAAFVVTNPTHVAVALEYRPPAVAVPRIVVRASGDGAREVKRRARELRLPIVENPPLARALLASAEAGDYIPANSYGAVAAIVATLVRETFPA